MGPRLSLKLSISPSVKWDRHLPKVWMRTQEWILPVLHWDPLHLYVALRCTLDHRHQTQSGGKHTNCSLFFGDGQCHLCSSDWPASTRLSYLLSSQLPQFWANRYEPPHPCRIFILLTMISSCSQSFVVPDKIGVKGSPDTGYILRIISGNSRTPPNAAP